MFGLQSTPLFLILVMCSRLLLSMLHDTSKLPDLFAQAAMSSVPASSEPIPSHLPEYIQERLNQKPQLQAKQVLSSHSLLP